MKPSSKTFPLPPLPRAFKPRPLAKLASRNKVKKLLSGAGVRLEDLPYLPDGQVNPLYPKRFVEKFCEKEPSFYAEAQLKHLPKFPLKGAHASENFVIFGNGPSLGKFKFSLLHRAVTIGTNTTSEFHHCRYLAVADGFALIRVQPFLDFEKTTLLLGSGIWTGISRRMIWQNCPADRVIPFYAARGDHWTPPEDRLIGCGPNIGHTALDIAILMGAKSILMVGCDGYKGKKYEELHSGSFVKTYTRALSKKMPIDEFVRYQAERDDQVHELFFQKQKYCESKGIRFAVWGPDNVYHRLNKIGDHELRDWC